MKHLTQKKVHHSNKPLHESNEISHAPEEDSHESNETLHSKHDHIHVARAEREIPVTSELVNAGESGLKPTVFNTTESSLSLNTPDIGRPNVNKDMNSAALLQLLIPLLLKLLSSSTRSKLNFGPDRNAQSGQTMQQYMDRQMPPPQYINAPDPNTVISRPYSSDSIPQFNRFQDSGTSNSVPNNLFDMSRLNQLFNLSEIPQHTHTEPITCSVEGNRVVCEYKSLSYGSKVYYNNQPVKTSVPSFYAPAVAPPQMIPNVFPFGGNSLMDGSYHLDQMMNSLSKLVESSFQIPFPTPTSTFPNQASAVLRNVQNTLYPNVQVGGGMQESKVSTPLSVNSNSNVKGTPSAYPSSVVISSASDIPNPATYIKAPASTSVPGNSSSPSNPSPVSYSNVPLNPSPATNTKLPTTNPSSGLFNAAKPPTVNSGQPIVIANKDLSSFPTFGLPIVQGFTVRNNQQMIPLLRSLGTAQNVFPIIQNGGGF